MSPNQHGCAPEPLASMTPEPSSNPHVRGFRIAVEGMKMALRNRDIGKAYLRLVALILVLSLALSGAGIWALWTHAVPAADAAWWLSAALWVARVIGTLVTSMVGPLLAIFLVNIAFPLFNRAVFLAGMRVVDPQRAAALEARDEMTLLRSVAISSWRLLEYLLGSLVFMVIGLIPVLGTIVGALGQLWWTARTVGWELLDPYFEALDIRHAEQREIIAEHAGAVVGFGLPISMMLAVPFVGPLMFGLAQAAAAAFVARELPVDPREGYPPGPSTLSGSR